MEACSNIGHHIPSLKLAGAIPHNTTISNAVAAALPHLVHIKLQYVTAVLLGYIPLAETKQEVQAEYGRAVAALLSLVGPRLRALEATGSTHFWPPECFAALQQCTALTSLQLEAGRREEYRHLDLCLGTSGSCLGSGT